MMWHTVSHRMTVPGGSGRSALYGGGAGAVPSAGGAGGGAGACGGGAGAAACGGGAGAGACGSGAETGAMGAAARTCGGAAGAGVAWGGVAGPNAAKTRFAVKFAASSTIPLSAYCVCALKSRPLEHTKSSGTHRSMVLAAYAGPTSTCGWLITRMNRAFGFPNRATAATWLATSAGIGLGTPSGAPSGMTFDVTKPATAAPWENPPSTILVLGQLAAIDSTCVLASLTPSRAVGKSMVAG